MKKLINDALLHSLIFGVILSNTPASALDADPDKGSEDGIERTIETTGVIQSIARPDGPIMKWAQWRDSALEALHLDVSFSYDSVAMGVFGNGDNKAGASGDAIMNLRWQITPDTGDAPLALAVRLRDREAFSDLDPSELRRETNALWGYVDGFNRAGFEVPEFYLHRRLFDRQLAVRLGQMSMDDFFDDHRLRSAKRSFLNQAFSSNPAAGFPGYGMGLVARWKSPQGWDLTVGASNMESPNLTDEARWTFDTSSLFKAVQMGYSFRGWQDLRARVQIMGWHADELLDYQLPEGKGISTTFEHEVAGRACAFVRYARSFGEAAPVAQLIALGFAQEVHDLDRVGMALAAGESSADRGSWQGALEIFFRHQVGPTFQITPDLQIACGDGFSGWRFVAGVRARLTF